MLLTISAILIASLILLASPTLKLGQSYTKDNTIKDKYAKQEGIRIDVSTILIILPKDIDNKLESMVKNGVKPGYEDKIRFIYYSDVDQLPKIISSYANTATIIVTRLTMLPKLSKYIENIVIDKKHALLVIDDVGEGLSPKDFREVGISVKFSQIYEMTEESYEKHLIGAMLLVGPLAKCGYNEYLCPYTSTSVYSSLRDDYDPMDHIDEAILCSMQTLIDIIKEG